MKYANPFDNTKLASYTVKTFGESVRQRREQLGMSVREMAKRVGMSPIYLSDIERGTRPAPSGINSGKDFMSILEKELCLTDSQKSVYTLMAELSRLSKKNLLDEYFINNPYALKFVLKAIQNDLNDAEWEKIYELIFSQN